MFDKILPKSELGQLFVGVTAVLTAITIATSLGDILGTAIADSV